MRTLAALATATLLGLAAGAFAADLPSILTTERVKKVGPTRTVVAATVVCPKGSRAAACRVRAPRTVKVALRGKRYTVRIHTPTIQDGRRGNTTATVSRAFRRQLKGRVATIRFLMHVGPNAKMIAQKVTA